MTELVLTRRARADLEALPAKLSDAVRNTIDRLALDPRLGKPLLGRIRGLWAIRVGNYRVLYTIEEGPGSSRVIVREIRHRAVVYRRRRKT